MIFLHPEILPYTWGSAQGVLVRCRVALWRRTKHIVTAINHRVRRFLAIIVAVGFFCACRRATPPDHPQIAAGVTMQDLTFYSPSLARQMPYRVFRPANQMPGVKLPVVYLLHGGGNDYRSWSVNSGVSQYALRGLILVMPEGDDSYFMNEVGSPRERYEDYITKDLIADVEGRFPARKDRAGRAIVGISMGGFAAVKYAFSHPDLYAFVGALSPSIDVPFRRYSFRRIGQWWKFRNIFGPAGSNERAARDPSTLIRTANPKAVPFIYLTAGRQEPLLGPNRQFAALLKRYGVEYEFHTEPGWHDWSQWNAQIPGCFAKLFQQLGMIVD
jgi:S-formylglutathione hydrolase FrmB